MNNQEKWNELVQKIQDLGDELQELSEGQPDPDGDLEQCLMGLAMTVDHLNEQEIVD